MVDRFFSDSRLAALYDAFCEGRPDFGFYLPLVMSAKSVLDVGCGTGALLRAAANWNPLEAVLRAQHALVGRMPDGSKWALIEAWARACLAWTERNREGIAAGIAKRSEVLRCPEVSWTPDAPRARADAPGRGRWATEVFS